MSRQRAPVGPPPEPAEKMRREVMRHYPKQREEDVDRYTTRLKNIFQRSLGKMLTKEARKHGWSKHKPHQGAKECARRAKQLKSGAICNYQHGLQYPQPWRPL